jgi:AcrR family transcriptional regulator
MHDSPEKGVDHRKTVAARRRAEMERHLFLVALELLTEKIPSEISINDVVRRANVSRGTFYSYFDSLDQVFLALLTKLAEDMAPAMDCLIVGIPDGAARVAIVIRFLLHFGRRAPVCGKLMMQSGWPIVKSANTFLGNLQRDVDLAMEQGTFDKMHGSVAANLIIGPTRGGLQAMVLGASIPDYPEQLTLRILLSLGMSRIAAEEAVALPLLEVDWQPDGLVAEILKMGELR